MDRRPRRPLTRGDARPVTIDTSRVTHVIVGFSAALLPAIDRGFTAGQVLFIEEPEVSAQRDTAGLCAPHPAVAGLLGIPCQDERGAERLPRMLERPARARAVLPGGEYGVVAAAALADGWNLPGAGLRTARVLRDKAELRRVAGASGIAQPDWRVVDGPQSIARFREAHPDCVIKPVDRQGSLGVVRIGPGDDPAEAWDEVRSAREPGWIRASDRPYSGRYLAEERLPGTEVSVEALVAAGEMVFANITAKDVLPGRYPVESGHCVPAGLPADATEQLLDVTRSLVQATAFRYGVVHAEWIIRGRTPYLVECAARLPGDHIATLIDLAYGTRLADDMFRVMAGQAIASDGRPRLAAAIRFLTAAPGLVTGIGGVERARDLDDVVNVELTVAEGDVVGPVRSSLDRVGSVIAVGPTAAEARMAAARAAAAIEVRTYFPARDLVSMRGDAHERSMVESAATQRDALPALPAGLRPGSGSGRGSHVAG